MHIAYIDPHPVPDDVPEALQILYTADALAALGVRVSLITPRSTARADAATLLGRAPASQLDFVNLPNLRKRWWFPIASNRAFYKMAVTRLAKLDVDAALIRNLKTAEAVLARAAKIPVFFETHELFAKVYREEHKQLPARKQRKLDTLIRRERLVYSKSRGLFALTSLLIDDIREYYQIQTPACVVPDGVDMAQAARGHDADIKLEGPVLLYLGSLHRWKGVEVLIEAMSDVPQGVLHVVGGNAERIGALRDLASRVGQASRVVFHGHVAPEKRFAYIGCADVCLLPLTETSIASRYTSPLKLFEYMAAGKAIVAADLPSIREVLTTENEALLVPVGSPKAFAAAICRVLADGKLADRLRRQAEIRAQAYSWSARAEIMMNFIAQHLGTRP